MNTFEIETIENHCRVCALELSDLTTSIPIFAESSKSFFLQNKISKYLYFTVLEEDLLPKKICATCFLKIESIDKFAYSASKNQECFLSWLKNKNQNKDDINQTTIEMSTNSDFSFSNITIKKDSLFSQKQQIVFQPHKTRNPRHVDHITLEQIINDQIIKNPKLPASTTITKIDEPKKQRKQQSQKADGKISIVSYHNLQIGQLIKDFELLKLILRALRWEEYDRKASYIQLIERLRKSNCRDILTNKNLLSDNDVVQLLRSYVNDSMLASSPPNTPHHNISKIFQPQPVLLVASPSTQIKANESAITTESITSSETMEVSIDPGMYLDEESITIEDDEETVSAAEAKIETAKLMTLKDEKVQEVAEEVEQKTVSFADGQQNQIQNNGKYVCSSCPETFSSNTELQLHVTTHLISSTSSSKISEIAIKKPLKRKKLKPERLRSKRKKITIRINPSPSSKRNVRERAKVLQAKFCCAICKKSLSSKRNVELHQETHKESNGKFRCNSEDGCKKLFGKLENFLKHRENVHEKPVRRRKNLNEK